MKDDQSFERLLRRARAGEPAAVGIGPCLDAETLAAWADGGLSSKQMAQAELHVSSCARCQAAVAATMTSAPLVASEIERPAHAWRLGWLVPLAAGVAAAGLWFMVPSRPATVTPAPESLQVAVDRAARAPIEQPTPPAPRDQLAPQPSLDKLADTRAAQNEQRQEAAAPAAKAEESKAQRADEFALERARQDADSKDVQNRTADNAAPKLQELSSRTAAAPASGPAAPPAPSAAAASGGAPAAARTLSSVGSSLAAGFQPVIVIVSPDPSSRWRIAGGGFLEHSTDGGATWTPQSSGVSVDLMAGASPSADVCWVVGRAGTVLRTTDGGRTWQRVTQVGGTDLQSVTASDASTAQVTAADGRVYRTVDAGNTWR